MMKKLFKQTKDDKGSSNTIAFMLIILVVMTMLVSFIDVGVYFNVKNEMRSAAENGARNVALYGGTTGELRSTKKANGAVDVVNLSIQDNYKNGTMVKVQKVVCGPDKAQAAGDSVWCDVTYKYNGLAGKFGMFQLGKDNTVTVRGTAVSEVGYKK